MSKRSKNYKYRESKIELEALVYRVATTKLPGQDGHADRCPVTKKSLALFKKAGLTAIDVVTSIACALFGMYDTHYFTHEVAKLSQELAYRERTGFWHYELLKRNRSGFSGDAS